LACAGVASARQQSVVEYLEAPDQPVRVKSVSLAKSGDLEVVIRNASPQAVRFVGFLLAPAECPAPIKPAALWMAYGDRSALDGEANQPAEAALLSGEAITLSLSATSYQRVLGGQVARGCSADALPQLLLDKVAYCDGTGWEGIADGADHSAWNGRPWTPKGAAQNCRGR
jgi:hypothetical protein